MASDVLALDDPEVLLDGLNRSALELLGLLGPRLKSQDDRRLIEELREVIRRTFTIQLLHRHDYIAVTGSQGAGKTTLMSTLYDLGPGFLAANAGLGEGLPILILENRELNSPRRRLHQVPEVPGQRLVQIREVDEAEWQRAISGGDSATLIAELEVPPRFFHGARRGFVLLPGFERATRRNRIAQTLMREALISAQAAIIVTDRSRLADDTQKRILEDLKQHVSEPVVAVSKSEPLDETARWEVAARAAEVFGISAEHVVFTDAASTDWLPALLEGLTRLTSFEQIRQRQFRMLGEALNDLGTIESRVSDALAESGDIDQSSKEQWASVLAAYDEAAKKVRRDVEKALTSELNKHTETATDRAKDSFGEAEGGVPNKVRNFFKKEAELDKARRERYRDAWAPAEVRRAAERALLSAARMDETPAPVGALSERRRAALPRGAEEQREQGSDDSLAIDTRLVDQLEVLVRPHDADLDRQITEDLLDAIRALPRIAVYVMGRAMPRDDLAPSAGDGNGTADAAGARDRVVGLVQEQRAAMLGLAGLLGLDVAIDGDLDLAAAPAAIHAALVGAGLSSGAATAVLGIAGVGVAAGLAINEVNKRDRVALTQIEARMRAYRDATGQAVNAEVWDLLDRGHEALSERGRKWHRLDASTADRLAAGRVLAELRERRVQLERTVANHPTFGLA